MKGTVGAMPYECASCVKGHTNSATGTGPAGRTFRAERPNVYRFAVTEPRRLRVVYLDHCAQLSGAEIALSRLLPALLDRVDPLVLLGEGGPLVDRLSSLGVRVEVVALDPRVGALRKDTVGVRGFDVRNAVRIAPYTLALARRLRRDKPDLVHTNSMKAALYGGVAARLAGVPMVWHLRDRVSPDYLPGPAVQLVRLATRVLPAVVVANSASTMSTVPRRRHSVVVDNAVIHDSVDLVASHNGPAGELTIGMVGRLTPWKGQHIFLEAFASALGGTGATARLIGSAMFGEDGYEAQLRAQARDLGIAEQVEFRGFREDVGRELNALDVLVHCSTSPEPFGQVVVEGMAAGLLVIAADEGGPAEIIVDGVDGLLVEPRRPELLADALRLVAHDPALRQRLGSAAMLSSSRFSPEATAGQVMEVYERVLRKR